MQNVEQTLLSQYANSPTITQWIDNLNDCLDPIADIDNFYNLIWNVATAQGYGLDVWGRIVGVTRSLFVSNGDFFGFKEAGIGADPFGQGIFYNGTEQLVSNYSLTDPQFLTLIYAKAFSNICDGSIASINQILLLVFAGRGKCYVKDGLDFTMQYYFEFQLTPVDAAILYQSGVFPRPTGVKATVVQGPY